MMQPIVKILCLVRVDADKWRSDFSMMMMILGGTAIMGAESLRDRKPLEKACTNTSGFREEITIQQFNIRGINHFN